MRNTKPRPPNCEACGQPTTLVRAEPHPKFANMLQRVFVCRCGTQTSDIVAATTRRPVLSARATTAIQGA
jgi:C4-type Zn-finger protein